MQFSLGQAYSTLKYTLSYAQTTLAHAGGVNLHPIMYK